MVLFSSLTDFKFFLSDKHDQSASPPSCPSLQVIYSNSVYFGEVRGSPEPRYHESLWTKDIYLCSTEQTLTDLSHTALKSFIVKLKTSGYRTPDVFWLCWKKKLFLFLGLEELLSDPLWEINTDVFLHKFQLQEFISVVDQFSSDLKTKMQASKSIRTKLQ